MEDTKNKVLVVVDMQSDFIDGALGSYEARAIVPNVCDKIKSWEGPIIMTADTHFKSTYAETTEGKALPVLHCIENTDGWCFDWHIIDALCQHEQQLFGVSKQTFGCLDLQQTVKESKFPLKFELVGLCTDVCVISNAIILRNISPYAEVTVDASCCAGVTPEKHRIALEAMKNCGIVVINDEGDAQ